MRLRNAGGNRSHADFSHELHADASSRIGVLQVVDQLREIFDRINVVMRRGRDQTDAWRRMAHARNGLIHFMARKLSALTGFCALSHLDLKFLCADQVLARYSEAS